MQKQEQGKETVDCYNCTGSKSHSMCGMAMSGCTLCETHGTGHGDLFVEYSKMAVKIGDEMFTPPNYSCLQCEDTKKTSRQIYDKDMVDNGCSDPCFRMPWVDVACWKCCEEQSDKDLKVAKDKHYASKKR